MVVNIHLESSDCQREALAKVKLRWMKGLCIKVRKPYFLFIRLIILAKFIIYLIFENGLLIIQKC